MNNIAPKLKKNAGHRKLPYENHMKNAKATKFPLQSALYTCKVLVFSDSWFKFYDKFCSPHRSSTFYAYLITKIGNRNLKNLEA